MQITATIIDLTFVYITTDLLSIPNHFNANTFERRTCVSWRTRFTSESRPKIDTSYSRKTRTCYFTFVYILTRCTISCETSRTTSTSEINKLLKREIIKSGSMSLRKINLKLEREIFSLIILTNILTLTILINRCSVT